MAGNLGKWSSKRGPISKIRPSDGCRRDAVPSTVVRGYDLRKLGGHLGNVGWMETAGPGSHRSDGPEAGHALTIKLGHS